MANTPDEDAAEARVEIVARELARWAPDAFASVDSFNGEPGTSKWPTDWSSRELAAFRATAAAILHKLGTL